MNRKYNAFLSHHSQDKPIVEKIALWLENNAGLSVWLDKWNLIPGDPWREEIEKALAESQCCVLFLGPNGIGPWQNEEMRTAIEERVSKQTIRIVPVLLPGAVLPRQESKLPPFLRRLTWVVFQQNWDEEGALHRLLCGIKGIPPGRDAKETEADICPYRGLEVFREQDQNFFFGREAVVQRLMDKLNTSRFLAVLGPSGCGKSSVVQAGLIPLLRKQSLVTLFTPRENPIEELAFALRKCYPENKRPQVAQLIEFLNGSTRSLHYIAREVLEDTDKKNLTIVIDQFEEVFTQTVAEEERQRFFGAILNAVEVVDGPVMVILTIRSDFMGKCALYHDLNMYISDYFFQIEPMSNVKLRSVIEEPARMVGLSFEQGLVDRMLNDVEDASKELPLLENALLELYLRRKGTQLTFQAYEEIGHIYGPLRKHAELELKKENRQRKNGENRKANAMPLRKVQILLVDNDHDFLYLLEKLLKTKLSGISINKASSPEEAIKKAKSEYYDLAVLGKRLIYKLDPDDESGIKLARELAEIHPGIKIIMLTSSPDYEDIIKKLPNKDEFGEPILCAYIGKNESPEEWCSIINDVIDKDLRKNLSIVVKIVGFPFKDYNGPVKLDKKLSL